MKNIHEIDYEVYITCDDTIKEGNWVYNIISKRKYKADKVHIHAINTYESAYKKIILTTDKYLIADGVQEIDWEVDEWLSENSDCEYIEVKKEIKKLIWELKVGIMEVITTFSGFVSGFALQKVQF
jgi:hypothetical protein